jgi:hypothetical protein
MLKMSQLLKPLGAGCKPDAVPAQKDRVLDNAELDQIAGGRGVWPPDGLK